MDTQRVTVASHARRELRWQRCSDMQDVEGLATVPMDIIVCGWRMAPRLKCIQTPMSNGLRHTCNVLVWLELRTLTSCRRPSRNGKHTAKWWRRLLRIRSSGWSIKGVGSTSPVLLYQHCKRTSDRSHEARHPGRKASAFVHWLSSASSYSFSHFKTL